MNKKNKRVSFSISEGLHEEIMLHIANNQDVYVSLSHFCRCAAIRLARKKLDNQ